MLGLAASGFLIGVVAEKRLDVWTRGLALMWGASYRDVVHDRATASRIVHRSGLSRAACPKSGRVMVLLAIGQSNAANYVVRKHKAGPGVVSFHEGACYRAEDPLPGATGDRGSVWTRLGDLAVRSGRFDHVVLVPIAVADTRMEAWAPGGVYHPMIRDRLSALAEAGLKPTHIIVQQGESDGNVTPPRQYQRWASSLLTWLKSQGKAPVYLALSSGCRARRDLDLREAQRRAAAGSGAMLGLDLDEVRLGHEANLCHLTSEGADRAAAQWLRVLR